jgi:hypothetical protein
MKKIKHAGGLVGGNTGATLLAMTAGVMNISKANTITDLDSRHTRPNFSDNPNSLVSEDTASLQRMFVGTTDARVGDFDDGVIMADFATRLAFCNCAVL